VNRFRADRSGSEIIFWSGSIAPTADSSSSNSIAAGVVERIGLIRHRSSTDLSAYLFSPVKNHALENIAIGSSSEHSLPESQNQPKAPKLSS